MVSWQWWREIRPNRSPEIDKVCVEAGAPVGSYWCEASRYSAHNRSAKRLGVRNPYMRTASVARQLAYAKSIGSGLKVIPMSRNPLSGKYPQLKPGDTFSMKHGGGTPRDIGRIWNGHTGIIVEDRGDYVVTIEGNGNVAGSRNGDRVIKRTRRKSELLAAIRIVEQDQVHLDGSGGNRGLSAPAALVRQPS